MHGTFAYLALSSIPHDSQTLPSLNTLLGFQKHEKKNLLPRFQETGYAGSRVRD